MVQESQHTPEGKWMEKRRGEKRRDGMQSGHWDRRCMSISASMRIARYTLQALWLASELCWREVSGYRGRYGLLLIGISVRHRRQMQGTASNGTGRVWITLVKTKGCGTDGELGQLQ